MNMPDTLREQLERLQRLALGAGIVGLLACGVGFAVAREQFFRSYLTGYLFWVGLALGSLALMLLHEIFASNWGFSIQRILEASTRTFPLLAVLFIPVLIGMHDLYHWTHAEAVAADPILQHKARFLNQPFFIGRTAFYFLAWIGLARLLGKWSQEMDETGSAQLGERFRAFGAPGLLIFGLTATFALVDWAMSLDPHWFSTMFALHGIASQVLATLAFCALMMRWLCQYEPMAGKIRASHFHDIGNLMLAFTMIWAYLGFSQFLIIWSGNLPETIPWYLHRSHGGWEWVAIGLLGFSFAVPFMVLLSRQTKRNIQNLAIVAALVLLMRLVDLVWIIAPNFHPGKLHIHWLDLAAPIGIGGVWIWFFLGQLKQRSLLPENDPRFVKAFASAEHHHG